MPQRCAYGRRTAQRVYRVQKHAVLAGSLQAESRAQCGTSVACLVLSIRVGYVASKPECSG
jgi:hypothetical protein